MKASEAQFPESPLLANSQKVGNSVKTAQFLSRSRGQYKGQVTRLTTRITEMEGELREFASAVR